MQQCFHFHSTITSTEWGQMVGPAFKEREVTTTLFRSGESHQRIALSD